MKLTWRFDLLLEEPLRCSAMLRSVHMRSRAAEMHLQENNAVQGAHNADMRDQSWFRSILSSVFDMRCMLAKHGPDPEAFALIVQRDIAGRLLEVRKL